MVELLKVGWGRRMRREVALQYRCYFLCIDMDATELVEQLDRRVDEMVAIGIMELAHYFDEEEQVKASQAGQGDPGG